MSALYSAFSPPPFTHSLVDCAFSIRQELVFALSGIQLGLRRRADLRHLAAQASPVPRNIWKLKKKNKTRWSDTSSAEDTLLQGLMAERGPNRSLHHGLYEPYKQQGIPSIHQVGTAPSQSYGEGKKEQHYSSLVFCLIPSYTASKRGSFDG